MVLLQTPGLCVNRSPRRAEAAEAADFQRCLRLRLRFQFGASQSVPGASGSGLYSRGPPAGPSCGAGRFLALKQGFSLRALSGALSGSYGTCLTELRVLRRKLRTFGEFFGCCKGKRKAATPLLFCFISDLRPPRPPKQAALTRAPESSLSAEGVSTTMWPWAI